MRRRGLRARVNMTRGSPRISGPHNLPGQVLGLEPVMKMRNRGSPPTPPACLFPVNSNFTT